MPWLRLNFSAEPMALCNFPEEKIHSQTEEIEFLVVIDLVVIDLVVIDLVVIDLVVIDLVVLDK